MTPLALLALMGVVTLVAVCGWAVELFANAELRRQIDRNFFDGIEAGEEAQASWESDKRHRAAKHARACQLEQRRAAKEATRLAIEASTEKVA